jgi:hypothetical protein
MSKLKEKAIKWGDDYCNGVIPKDDELTGHALAYVAGFRLALKLAAERIRNWNHLGGASEATLVTCRNIERDILALGSEEK